MLRGVVRALYEHYGVDPTSYVRLEDDGVAEEKEGAGTPEKEGAGIPEKEGACTPSREDYIANPKTPGGYSDENEEPPTKVRKVVHSSTPIAKRRNKRKQKKVLYSPLR